MKKCQKGIKLLEQGKHSEAAIFFDKTIKYSKKNDLIYRMAFACYVDQKDYSKAQVICEIIRKEGYNLTSDELVNTGFIYGKFNKYEEAIKDYTDALFLNPNNKYALNNRGDALNYLKKYEEAITDFDKAIEENPDFSYPYINRGFTKIMLGKLEEGLNDIEHSFSLEKENSYAFRNRGIYFFEIGNYQKAMENFVKAKEIDQDTLLVDHYITLAENKLA